MSSIKLNDKPFITVWRVSGSADTIEVGVDTSNFDETPDIEFDVDWGDGTVEHFDNSSSTPVTHTYSSDGDYDVSVFSDPSKDHNVVGVGFSQLSTAECLGVKQWGTIGWQNFAQLFGDVFVGSGKLDYQASDTPDLSDVSSLKGMFKNTSFDQDIGNWDLANVMDVSNMFLNATDFDQDIGDWDVFNVTDMANMFEGATSFNQNLEKWDVSNVEKMVDMFKGSGMTNTNISNTLSGWVDPNVNKGSNGYTDLQSSVSIHLNSVDYNNLSADAQKAVDNLRNNKSWTFNGVGNLP